jgi:hypothetical protein
MIPARSTEQIEQAIKEDIRDNRPDFDLESGPMHDVVVTPQVSLIKKVEDDIEHASELTSLKYWDQFSTTELDDFAGTYGITRLQGLKGRTIIAFVMYNKPQSDINIPAGTIVSLPPDQKINGESFNFATIDAIFYHAVECDQFCQASGNIKKWIFTTPAQAVKAGSYSNGVQPRKLTHCTLVTGIGEIYNTITTRGGTDIEDNEHFANRILSIMGYNSILTPEGLKKFIYDSFPDQVIDITVVKGNKVARAPNVKQAIDIYVIGEYMKSKEETFTYDGSRKYKMIMQPALDISSVVGNINYAVNTDYRLSKDIASFYLPGLNNFTQEGAVSGSIKSNDSLVWNLTTGGNIPTVSESIAIKYAYNALIRDIQEKLQDELDFIAVDVLVREGIIVPIYMGFTVTLKSISYDSNTVYQNIVTSIQKYINKNKFGDNLATLNTDKMLDTILKEVSGINTINLDYFNREKHLVVTISDEINLSLKRVGKTIELKWNYGIRASEIINTDSVGIYRSEDNGITYTLINTVSAAQLTFFDEPNTTNLVYKIVVTTSSKVFNSNLADTYSNKPKRIEEIVLKDAEYSYTDSEFINVRFI